MSVSWQSWQRRRKPPLDGRCTPSVRDPGLAPSPGYEVDEMSEGEKYSKQTNKTKSIGVLHACIFLFGGLLLTKSIAT